MISLEEVGKRIAGKVILQELNLTINQGESLAILGNNGTGKSTLLKLIGGLSNLSEGNRKLHKKEGLPTIGFVPDRFPKVRFSGYEYLRHMGLIRKMPIVALESRINDLMVLFGLDSEASRRPIRQYSKGMIQKINVMQALLEPPDLLLLDEPLSGLDWRTQEELSRVLFSLKAQGITIVLTSHEKGLTEKLADRIVVLSNGRIKEVLQNSGNVKTYKEIECVLPETEELANWTLKNGVLECEKIENRYRFRVNSKHSDSLLKEVLDSDGSIYSVLDRKGEIM